jgi:putative addiction module killer protein
MKAIKMTDTFKKWLTKLRDQKAKAIITARLHRVSAGLLGDVLSIGEGISELRIHYGPGYRLYFKERAGQLIILLCGGDKSSQERDIILAKKLAHHLGDYQ